MNQNQQQDASKAVVIDPHAEASLIDTLVDVGLAWAEFGVGQGKRALETSVKTLEKVAGSLDDLQRKLRKPGLPG